jgi:DNA-binding transcriptional regulator YdaS (Cro superfamily)
MHTSLKGYRIATGDSLSQVARRFGVNKSTVFRWQRDRVPAERVPDVERELGIPRHYLRPDLWLKQTENRG